MVAEALAVFGAIGTSIALLNLARQGFETLAKGFKEYAKVGRDILDIQRRIENLCFLIEEWKRFWFFDLPASDELLKAYWGQRGASLIANQLAAIDVKCEDLAAVFEPFVVDAEFSSLSGED